MRRGIAALFLVSAMGFRTAPAAHAIIPVDTLAAAVAAGLAFAPGDTLLVAGLIDGALVIRPGEDAPPRRIALPSGRYAAAVAVTPDRLLIADTKGTIHVRDLAGGDSIRAIPAGEPIADIVLSPDGTMVAAACPLAGEGYVAAFRIADGVEVFRTALAVMPVAVAWTHDGRSLVCATEGDRVVILDAPTGASVREIRRSRHILRRYPGTVAATSDGIYLAAADDAVGLWRRADGVPVRAFGAGEPEPEGIALSADGRWLAAAGTRHGVSLWEVDTGVRIHHVPGDSTRWSAVAISANGRHIATGGAAGIVLWRVEPPFRPPGTPVAGAVVTTAWTAANSPYRITGDIVVPPGETLAIDPGVEVLFDVDARISVEGSLRAIGTETDSIRFLPGSAREWGGIRISGGDSSAIACARIGGAYPGNPGGIESGGGLAVIGPQTRIALAGVVFENNASNLNGGGFFLADTARATLVSCALRGNRSDASGGGLFARRSAIDLTDCRVAGNAARVYGGGIAIESLGADAESGGASLVRCHVIDNTASTSGGGLSVRSAAAVAERCLLAGNRAEFDGAAIHLAGVSGRTASLALASCTVAGNRVATGQSAISAQSAAFSVAGSIVWNLPPFALAGNAAFAVRYTDVAGTPTPSGTGNFSADPRFADAAAGDYALRSDSPCIDAGDPDSPRDPDDSRADIGAIPSSYGVPLAVAPTVVPPPFTLHPAAPNPFNPSTAIRFSLPAAGDVRLAVCDLSGRIVRTLADGAKPAGSHTVVWDGRDASGRPCASGVYLVRLDAPAGTLARRMVLVR